MTKPTVRAALAAVVAVAAVGVLASVLWSQWQSFWGGPNPYYFFDTDFYRKAVVAVITGSKSMFEAMAYPPFAYLFLWWLPSVPMVVGDQIWTVATYLVLGVVSVVLTARALEASGRDWRPRPLVLVAGSAITAYLLLMTPAMYSQITCGQLSLLVIALPFLDVARVLPRRFEGVLVGMAAAIKVTPMIFAIYYLVTGQRRQAVNAGVSFVAFTGIGALFFPAQTLEYWTKFASAGQEVDALLRFNWGIRSVIARISPELATHAWVWAGLGAVIMVITLWRSRLLYLRGQGIEAALIVGAVSVVVPPNSLPHYYTWMPMLAIWLVITGGWWAKALGLGIFLLYSNYYYPDFITWWSGNEGPRYVLALSMLTAVPVLLGAFGVPRRSQQPSAPSEPAQQTVVAAGERA
jgi:alpha-1,2-mannosyltransferase